MRPVPGWARRSGCTTRRPARRTSRRWRWTPTPSVSMAKDGQAIVTWSGTQGSRAQRYDAAGTPAGDPIFLTLAGLTSAKPFPVAMDADVDFAIAWEAQDQPDTSFGGTFTKRFVNVA